MTRDTRRAGAFLVALGGVVAMLVLLAGPAAAQTSGEAYAENGSVASGSADARNNSTASGDADARNGSVASGCSTAVNASTASGDDCDAEKKPHHKHDDRGDKCPPPSNLVVFSDGSSECIFPEGDDRPRATATRATLALTGSLTGPLALTAALATGLGLLLLISTSDRRRASATRYKHASRAGSAGQSDWRITSVASSPAR
ncbi:MAG: hypothetical protein LC733_10755 [Actinobacteria bacterium]|nr:hypothetical protein [Actinomycetota bacterium]